MDMHSDSESMDPTTNTARQTHPNMQMPMKSATTYFLEKMNACNDNADPTIHSVSQTPEIQKPLKSAIK
jgi:hypothetical protein